MNRKYINSILVGCAVMGAFSACTDVWDEHYQADKPIAGQETANENLWELISNDDDLDEFAALLEATGYHELLQKNRSYTVWAPADGSGFIDEAVLQNLGKASKEELESYKKRIVENHIAHFNHVASGIRDKEDRKNYEMVEMLNSKKYDFEGTKAGEYTFAGKNLQRENIVAKNGMLHKLDGYVGFAANIWEQLADEEQISDLWNFLKKDFKREFNPTASVQGPIVDGQVTWLDSAFTEECRWFGEIGWLDREDSSYTMYAMTNRAWNEMYELAKQYFVYPTSMTTLPAKGGLNSEQTTDSIVKNLMCRNLVFSNTVNKKFFEGKKDTLVSNYRYDYQIFENEEAHALSNGLVGEPIELSNGSLYIVDAVNYNPFTIWHDTLRVEGESLSNADDTRLSFDYANKSVHSIHRDSLHYDEVSGHSIGIFEATSGWYNPVLNFYVNNVLSSYYRISVVLAPTLVIEPRDSTFIKPNKFEARLYYSLDGTTSQNVKLMGDTEDGIFISDTTDFAKLDTIVLAESIYIPVCEFDLKGLSGNMPQTRITIESKIEFGRGKDNSGNKRDAASWKYDNYFRIDQLIFEPISAPTEGEYFIG